MSTDLAKQLRDLKNAERRITPDPAWVRATRETLLMQAKNSLPSSASVTHRERVSQTFRMFAPRRVSAWVRRPVIAFMTILLVASGGSIFSVSAAEQALPGDLLYGLKLATEQARLAFTPVKTDRLILKTEFTKRRVDDLKKVATDTQHPGRVTQAAEILKQDLNTLKQQLGDVASDSSADQTAAAAKLVDQKTAEVITSLQQTKAQLSPASQEKVTEAQSAAADTSVTAIEVLATTHAQDENAVPTSDVTHAIEEHAKAVTDATSGATPTLSTGATSTKSTTSTPDLLQIASSTSATTTLNDLPALVNQVKDATQQAFAMQKTLDQAAVSSSSTGDLNMDEMSSSTTSASSTSMNASSTTDLTDQKGTTTPSVQTTSSSDAGPP